MSLAAVMLAALDVPDEDNYALAEVAQLEGLAGPSARAKEVDALWRGHTPRPRPLSLLAAADESGRVPVGWNAWTDEPVLWDQTSAHLALHTDDPACLDEGAHAATAVAVHLVRRYGPDAVTLVDADPAANTADPADRAAARRRWAPLAEAGMNVHPLAADLGRAVGALAAVAGTALARPYPPGDEAPRYLVLLHAHRLLPTLAGAGEHAYAAAARDTLRIIRNHGSRRRVHLVASHLGAPPRTRDPLASLSTPDSGEWSFMKEFSDVPAQVLAGPPSPRVVLPGPVSSAWWAAHLGGAAR